MKKLPLFFVTLALAIALSPFAAEAQLPDLDCDKKTDPAVDIAIYTKAIKLNATDYKALVMRGIAYRKTGNHEAALKDFNRAIALLPQADHAYYHRGVLYANRDDRAAAIENFSQAIERNPFSPNAYYCRGRINWGVNKEQSLSDFSKALELEPWDARVYSAKAGAALYIDRKSQSAIFDMSKAVELLTAEVSKESSTSCVNALLFRGWANTMLLRSSEAVADFGAVIKKDSENLEGYIYRAHALYFQKKYISALNDLDKAISLNPSYAAAYEERARVFEKLNQKERAQADRQMYKTLSSTDPGQRPN